MQLALTEGSSAPVRIRDCAEERGEVLFVRLKQLAAVSFERWMGVLSRCHFKIVDRFMAGARCVR